MAKVQAYVDRLCLLTEKLVERIGLVEYEELEHFSKEREELVTCIAEVREQLLEEDLAKLRKLGDHDHCILSRMEFFRDEASQWLRKKGAITVQKSAYTSSFTTDGMFFDRRN